MIAHTPFRNDPERSCVLIPISLCFVFYIIGLCLFDEKWRGKKGEELDDPRDKFAWLHEIRVSY